MTAAALNLRRIMRCAAIDGLTQRDFDEMWKVAKTTEEIRALARVEAILFPL